MNRKKTRSSYSDGPGLYQPVDRGIFVLYLISDYEFFAVFIYELFRT